MIESQDIPNDDNGQVLRRLLKEGDDFTQPRNIDFEFVFEFRSAALGFAEEVDDKDLTVKINWYEKANAWNVQVTRHMLPSHGAITTMESQLSEIASRLGGRADGWGCFAVKSKSGKLDNP